MGQSIYDIAIYIHQRLLSVYLSKAIFVCAKNQLQAHWNLTLLVISIINFDIIQYDAVTLSQSKSTFVGYEWIWLFGEFGLYKILLSFVV